MPSTTGTTTAAAPPKLPQNRKAPVPPEEARPIPTTDGGPRFTSCTYCGTVEVIHLREPGPQGGDERYYAFERDPDGLYVKVGKRFVQAGAFDPRENRLSRHAEHCSGQRPGRARPSPPLAEALATKGATVGAATETLPTRQPPPPPRPPAPPATAAPDPDERPRITTSTSTASTTTGGNLTVNPPSEAPAIVAAAPHLGIAEFADELPPDAGKRGRKALDFAAIAAELIRLNKGACRLLGRTSINSKDQAEAAKHKLHLARRVLPAKPGEKAVAEVWVAWGARDAQAK